MRRKIDQDHQNSPDRPKTGVPVAPCTWVRPQPALRLTEKRRRSSVPVVAEPIRETSVSALACGRLVAYPHGPSSHRWDDTHERLHASQRTQRGG